MRGKIRILDEADSVADETTTVGTFRVPVQTQLHRVNPTPIPSSSIKVHSTSLNLKHWKRQARAQGQIRDSMPTHLGEQGKRKVGTGVDGYTPSDRVDGVASEKKSRS